MKLRKLLEILHEVEILLAEAPLLPMTSSSEQDSQHDRESSEEEGTGLHLEWTTNQSRAESGRGGCTRRSGRAAEGKKYDERGER